MSGGVDETIGLDPVAFRQVLGAFVTGVTVITTVDENGERHGLTANSFNSVSLDPPLILWSLRLNATSFSVFSRAERFVINILAEDQVEISNRFAKSQPDRFVGIPVTEGIGGLPLIEGCAAHLECRKEAAYPGGDHVVFLGRVERIRNAPRKSLAFGSGRYLVVHQHDLGYLSADERAGTVASLGAVHLARPVLEELGRETDKTVGLAVWGNYGPTMIWWCEARQPLALNLRCGLVVPLSITSTGLVFAAFSPPELTTPLLSAEFASGKQVGADEHALRQQFETRVAEVRQARLAHVPVVQLPGVSEGALASFSAPGFDASGAIVLAMTLMATAGTLGRGDPAVQSLVRATEGLSRRLGYPGQARA